MFAVLGSSSAALIGLLFIAASLHVKEVVNNPVFYRRAFNNTCYLLIMLVEALLILIPQPIHILGAELVAINLFGLSPLHSLSHRGLFQAASASRKRFNLKGRNFRFE